jgi:hypothetical protein
MLPQPNNLSFDIVVHQTTLHLRSRSVCPVEVVGGRLSGRPLSFVIPASEVNWSGAGPPAGNVLDVGRGLGVDGTVESHPASALDLVLPFVPCIPQRVFVGGPTLLLA